MPPPPVGWGRAREVATRAGTAGTHSPVGRALGRTWRENVLVAKQGASPHPRQGGRALEAGRQLYIAIDGALLGSGVDGASTPGRDRQARRRDRTGAVRVVLPAAAVGASPDAVRQALAAARLRDRPALGGRGEGVRSGERVGEGATAGRPGAGRGEWAPGPAQPAPSPPSTPRSPSAVRQGARLSASDPRGRREATGSKRSSPGRSGAEAGVVGGRERGGLRDVAVPDDQVVERGASSTP